MIHLTHTHRCKDGQTRPIHWPHDCEVGDVWVCRRCGGNGILVAEGGETGVWKVSTRVVLGENPDYIKYDSIFQELRDIAAALWNMTDDQIRKVMLKVDRRDREVAAAVLSMRHDTNVCSLSILSESSADITAAVADVCLDQLKKRKPELVHVIDLALSLSTYDLVQCQRFDPLLTKKLRQQKQDAEQRHVEQERQELQKTIYEQRTQQFAQLIHMFYAGIVALIILLMFLSFFFS